MAGKGRTAAPGTDRDTHAPVTHDAPVLAVERLQHAAGNRAVSRALDPDVRAELEDRLGGDLSQVRVHLDAERAGELGAAAFTEGSDVYFAPGVYEPQTRPGRAVIAHELAHVLQQSDHSGSSGVDLEAAADAAALGGGPVVGSAPAGTVQRVTPEEAEDLRFAAEESGRAGRGGAFGDDPDFYRDLHELGPAQEDEDYKNFYDEVTQKEFGYHVPRSKNPPGSKPEDVNKAAGRAVHSYVQHIVRGQLSDDLAERLKLKWPKGVAPNEGEGRLIIQLPDGKRYIPDGINWEKGIVYELKPRGSWAEGRDQATIYQGHLNRQFPPGPGRSWKSWRIRVITYDLDAAIDWLTSKGLLPPGLQRKPAKPVGGKGGGGTGKPRGGKAKVAAEPPVQRSPSQPAPPAPEPPVKPKPPVVPTPKPAPKPPVVPATSPSPAPAPERTVPVRTVEGGVGLEGPPTAESPMRPAPTRPAPTKPVPPPAPPSLQEIRQTKLNTVAARQTALHGAATMVGQGFNEYNMGLRQAEEVGKAYAELARLQPEIDRLTAQGYWVVKVVTFDVPAIPDFFGQVAGWTEEKDIKRFVGANLRYGKTREDAFEDRGRPEGPQLYAADPSIAYRAAPQLPRVQPGRRWEEAVIGVVPPDAAAPEFQLSRPAEQISGHWKTTGEPQESSLEILVTPRQPRVSMRWAGGEYGVAGVRWLPDEGVLQVRFTSDKLPGWVRDSTFQLVGPGLIRETYVAGYPAARGQGVTDSGQRVWGEPTHFRAAMEKIRR